MASLEGKLEIVKIEDKSNWLGMPGSILVGFGRVRVRGDLIAVREAYCV